MAAETQPRFICGQPTHSAAWEGMKSGQRPPHGTPAQSSQRGGPRVSRPAGGEHVRAARPEQPGSGFRAHSISSQLSDLRHNP